MIVVAHDDVADADGDPDAPCPLDLSAADLDRVAMADILFDRRRKPRRRDVEIDRSGAEPPPQGAEAAHEDHYQGYDNDRKPPDPAFPDHPSPQRGDLVPGAMKPGIRFGQQPSRMPPGRLVIPIRVVPLGRRDVGRSGRLVARWAMRWGRRLPCHSFLMPALIGGLIAATAAPVDR